MSEITELIEKARKWDRVMEMSKTDDCYPVCPFVDDCVGNDVNCCFKVIVDAFEGENGENL